jgi:2-oxoglutarate ferredoxin oxidoreductase subunit alpha
MTDLDLGMNNWVSTPFKPITKPINRGKVLTTEELERLGKFQRYADVDGDGIPYRTLPGTKHPLAAYFTRGTGHTINATYSERPEDWKLIIDRLAKKFETARKELPPPVIDLANDGKADIGIIAYGSTDVAMSEARHQLETESDIKTDYLRIRALPAHEKVREFIANHRVTYVVEQNRDAQLASILRMDWPEVATNIKSVLYYDGLPIDARSISDGIVASEKVRKSP